MLASTLVTGSISWLYYSDRLLELPIGLVAVALGTVLLPNLSRLHRESSLDGFRSTLGWAPRFDDLETIVRTSLEWERKIAARDPGAYWAA